MPAFAAPRPGDAVRVPRAANLFVQEARATAEGIGLVLVAALLALLAPAAATGPSPSGPAADVCGDLGPLCGPCGLGVSTVLGAVARLAADPAGTAANAAGALVATASWLAGALVADPAGFLESLPSLFDCAA